MPHGFRYARMDFQMVLSLMQTRLNLVLAILTF